MTIHVEGNDIGVDGHLMTVCLNWHGIKSKDITGHYMVASLESII